MTRPLRVGVYGAGAIGTYVGVCLASAGVRTTLLGRDWLVALRHRLAARGIDGREVRASALLEVTEDPVALADVDLCLLTVKSRHTAGAAAELAERLPPGVPVVSLQNGLDNPRRIRAAGLTAVAGMVTFNVFREDGVFHQATSGPVMLEDPMDERAQRLVLHLADALREAGEEVEVRRDMDAVQAGKLLLNLNNGVCAVAGVSIAESIGDRRLRRAFAACIDEGLEVFARAGRPVAKVAPLHPRAIARLLRLPDAVVRLAARPLVQIDPQARSSTLQDLEAGKPTEIDELSGALVRLAEPLGVGAPCNGWIVEQVRRLEESGRDRRHPDPDSIWQAIRQRRER